MPPARIPILSALVERIGRRGTADAPELEEPAVLEPPPAEPVQPEPEVEPEPQAAVSERSARALLATGPPPLPPEPAKPKAARRRRIERRPEPPDPEPAPSGPARAWNIWDLQRLARETSSDERHDEWSALLMHLREFANADGELPVEFDGLVRESFAGVLGAESEVATAAT